MARKVFGNMPESAVFAGDRAEAIALQGTAGLPRAPFARGVFSKFPTSTPKWTNRGGPAEPDFRNTMARMFVDLDEKELTRFLASVDMGAHDGDTNESKILASVLAGPRTANKGTGYIDFLLQSVQMPFEEKTQVVETLADNYVIYYFGQAAVPFTFAGTVLNTVEDDQAINMLRIYRDILRGTQLARRRKLLRLRFNGMLVSGSVMGLELGLTAESEMSLSFAMRVMPKVVTLLPNPDFGNVILNDKAGGSVPEEAIEKARVPTAQRFTILSAANAGGAGATKPVDTTEDEASDLANPNSDEAIARDQQAQADLAAGVPSVEAASAVFVEPKQDQAAAVEGARSDIGAGESEGEDEGAGGD